MKLLGLLPIFFSTFPLTLAIPSPVQENKEYNPARTRVDLNRGVPGSYIVVLRKDITREIFTVHAQRANIQNVYNFGSFHGYAARLDEIALEQLKRSPEVDYVQSDGIVTTSGYLVNSTTSNWNLFRISSRVPPKTIEGPFSYIYDSEYVTSNCSNEAYVIDSGINLSHDEFEGRASFGTNTIGGTNGDGAGHGTHVAGILAGKTFGVARKSKVVAVKVLDNSGYGTFGSVIAGLNWAVKEIQKRGTVGKAVINMSLIGPYNQALNDAVKAAVKAGIPVAVAAGNYGDLAVNYSPSCVQEALVVGAIDAFDTKPYWSNYGAKLDLFAPGVYIRSAYNTSANATAVFSGTSMAAPHVAGMVNYLQCVEGLTCPRMVRERLEQLSTVGLVKDGGNTSPNRILFNGAE